MRAMVRRAVWLGVLAAVVLLGFAGVSVTQTVEACVARGRAVLAAADPLDRAPPALVAAVIDAHVPRGELPDRLSAVLLDRLSCGGRAGTDWLAERPALSWRLARTFDTRDVLGLFVSTMDTAAGPGTLGLNAGARRFYDRPIDKLNAQAVECLVRKALGRARVFGARGFTRGFTCGREGG